ncbi:MAG: hypothetical protein RL141_202 [Candidatus Parcubacteria bacterium]|jgi:hypothetical protein
MPYLHAINLKNELPCWNLRISNRLWSADCVDERANKNGEHPSFRDASLETLRQKKIPTGFLQPRAMSALADPRKWDMEMAFEEARRTYAPEAPSRLSCLYVCEDSDVGRAALQSMFGDRVSIFNVEIVLKRRWMRADLRWVDAYYENPRRKEVLKQYWNSEPFSEEGGSWECLLDGIIIFTNEQQLQYIRQHGARFSTVA